MAMARNQGGRQGEQQHLQQGHASGAAGQGQRSDTSSATGMLGTARDKAQELASNVADKAGDAWDAATQQAQQLGSAVADNATQAWGNVNDFFNRYGLPMFFVGIGVGFLIAKAFDNMSADMTSRMSRASSR